MRVFHFPLAAFCPCLYQQKLVDRFCECNSELKWQMSFWTVLPNLKVDFKLSIFIAQMHVLDDKMYDLRVCVIQSSY